MEQPSKHENGDGQCEDELALARRLAEHHDRWAISGDVNTGESLVERPEPRPELGGEIYALDLVSSLAEEKTPVRKLGDFELLRELGRGAMGIVYEARQLSLGRRVALKILPMTLLENSSTLERFRREAMAAAGLNHPNLVAVYSAGEEAGTPYFAMEFAEGSTLQEILQRLRALAGTGDGRTSGSWWELASSRSVCRDDPEVTAVDSSEEGIPPGPRSGHARVTGTPYYHQVAELFAGAAEGLQHAHERGVIHRDLKPSNLVLDPVMRLRILDFGLARIEGLPRITSTERCPGTPLYMSPEQAQGQLEALGPGTDLYSLGATLYEMLILRPPVEGKNIQVVHDNIVHQDPIRLRKIAPAIPRDLETIVLKCLRKKPADRYLTAEALAQDLRRFLRGDPIEARPEPLLERVTRRTWRSRWRILQAAVALALVVTLGVLFAGRRERSLKERLAEYDRRVDAAALAIVTRRLLSPTVNLAAVEEERVQLAGNQVDAPIVSRETDGSSAAFEAGAGLLEAGPAMPGVERDSMIQAVESMREAIGMFPRKPIAYYQLAHGLFLQGRLEEASRELDQSLRLKPDFLPALSLRASILRRQGSREAKQAEEALLRIAGASGDGWPSAWIEAHRAVLEQEWKRAAAAFDRLGRTSFEESDDYHHSSVRIETLLGRGVAHFRVGEYDLALSDFGGGKALWPDVLEPEIFLAKIHFLKGNTRLAARIFEDLQEETKARGRRDPDAVALTVVATCRELGDFETALEWSDQLADGPAKLALQADLLWLLGDRPKARSACERTLELDDKNLAAHITFGNILRSEGETEKALERYRFAATLFPDDPRPVVALGIAFEASGRLEEAIGAYERALEMDASFAQGHYNLGRILSKVGRVDSAVQAYRAAIRVDPGNAPACNNLGVLHDQRDEPEEARRLYERAVELAPEFAQARYNLAWIYERENRFGEAAEEYLAALDLGFETPVLHSNLAKCLQKQRKSDDAIREYREAIDRDREYSTPHHDLGTALIWKDPEENLDEAVAAYRKAIDVEPQRADSHKDLGWALAQQALAQQGEDEETIAAYRKAKVEEAIAAYRKAIELDPLYAPAHRHLADLLLREGRPVPEGEELRSEINRLEDAAHLVNTGGGVSRLLETYRGAFLPDLASCASIDWLLDLPERLLGEGATWRFHRGATEPSPGLEWTRPEFDDSTWEAGPGPFGYGEERHYGSRIEDMEGSYTTLYLRTTVAVPDPDRYRQIVLSVAADDGFVAYLDGEEIGRVRAGVTGKRNACDATADATAPEPLFPSEFVLEPRRFAAPACLALQILNASASSSDLVALAVLEAMVRPDPERDRQRMRDFRVLAEASGRAGLLAYLEGRLLQRSELYRDAIAEFQEAAALDPSRLEPVLRIAECLLAQGDAAGDERVLREALRSGLSKYERLWDRWLHVALVEVAEEPAKILETLSEMVANVVEDPGERAGDLLWLLGNLAHGEPLRINCGGKRYVSGGIAWSEDRFFRGGWGEYLHGLDAYRERIDHTALYQNERYFDDSGPLLPAYSIPLPRGNYRLTLHFIEGYSDHAGARRFDVLTEGATRFPDLEPLLAGFGIPQRRRVDVAVNDGALDIAFVRQAGHPEIAAVEVERLEAIANDHDGKGE